FTFGFESDGVEDPAQADTAVLASDRPKFSQRLDELDDEAPTMANVAASAPAAVDRFPILRMLLLTALV
ncbi:hypothetical protein NL375_30240, partial [Klebsiella pneumoniae]|nr:hypothetical protein [Klebsiella pneumoniae]